MERPKPNPITFSSQTDSKYQYAVEAGINSEIRNFCWLACVDMAISAFVTDEGKRTLYMKELAKRIAGKGNFMDGRVKLDSEDQTLIKELTQLNADLGLDVEINFIGDLTFNTFQDELNDGAVILFSTKEKDSETSHLRIMDKILFQESDYAVFNTFDPADNDANTGRRLVSNRELFLLHTNELMLLSPFIVTFKKHQISETK
jgi:hypothetical protein